VFVHFFAIQAGGSKSLQESQTVSLKSRRRPRAGKPKTSRQCSGDRMSRRRSTLHSCSTWFLRTSTIETDRAEYVCSILLSNAQSCRTMWRS